MPLEQKLPESHGWNSLRLVFIFVFICADIAYNDFGFPEFSTKNALRWMSNKSEFDLISP